MTTIERIQRLIKERGITAKKLTEDICINHSSINGWKKGIAKPSYGAIVKIAKYFDVSEDYLLCKTGDPTPKSEDDIDEADDLIKRLNNYKGAFAGGAEEGLTDSKRMILEAAIKVIEEAKKAKGD